MEAQVTQVTDEHADNVLGAVGAANIANLPKKKSGTITIPKKAVAVASTADPFTDLVHKIENLKKSDAIARLVELEEAHEKTYFEIGGVLSVMQREKWFDPFASLDEWVENNTAMKRSKARALIQIYDKIADCGVTWAQIKHIRWTKLRAIARVLNKENADEWIGVASKQSKAEIIKTAKAHLATLSGTQPGGSTATHAKTFKFHDDQVKTVDAAIEKAKKSSNTPHNSVALEYICLDYMGGSTLQQRFAGLAPEAVAKTFVDVLKAFDKHAAEAIVKSVMAEVSHDFEVIV